jgi:drug/metabolite transporter (DMT)-like permease
MLIITILISVCLAAAAQLTLKYGMNQVVDRNGAFSLTDGDSLKTLVATPAVYLGLALFGLSAVVWLAVLSKASLSFAYPFASLTYVLIVLFDQFVLHEPVTALRWSGVLLIVAGIILVSRGAT